MFRQLKKTVVATLIAAVTVGQVLPAFADSSDSLPDMGTTAGSTLSIVITHLHLLTNGERASCCGAHVRQ